MEPTIVVHGGAGNWENRDFEGAMAKADAVAEEGQAFLQSGGTALDAVERVINELEADPRFNAGTGGYLQLDGTVRLDAAIMTEDRECGAVSSLEGFEAAISVARDVMELTPHVMLSGPQAADFAEAFDYERSDLETPGMKDVWEDVREPFTDLSYRELVTALEENAGMDTVGCVAIDETGAIAAGTSTGGRKVDLPGRVGDSPLPGAGVFCTEAAGTSLTGVGEDIIRTSLAKECVSRVDDGATAPEATTEAIAHLSEHTSGTAGIIAIDAAGRVGIEASAQRMVHASRGGE